MELHPAVALLVGPVRLCGGRVGTVGDLLQFFVVLAVPERVGERGLHRGAELRTAARVDRLVDRIAAEHQFDRCQVGRAVRHHERRPVFQRVAFVAGFGVEREIGIGPVQTLAQTGGDAVGPEILRTGLPYVIGVVLLREVCREGKRVGFLAAHPGVGETEREGLVIRTVGLRREREPLVLAHRVGAPCAFLEGVLDREVVQRDADRTHEGSRTPAAGDVELVGSLLFKRPVDVDQLVRNGLDVGHDGLGVEVSHRTQQADGAHQQRAVVEFARTGVQLAADHLVVDALIARDADFVDGKLLAFEDLDFDVDRVRGDDRLGGFDLRHQVAFVLIERRHGCRFGIGLLADAQLLVHRLLIVDVALLDAEHLLQPFGFIDRVAHPRDVADVVFVAFRHFEVDAQPFFVDRVDRVAYDGGIAVAPRVVEVDQQLLVRLVVVLVEFGPLEEVDRLLVGLFERAAQALVVELLVADEVDLADLHFFLAVDQEGHRHGLSRAQRVVVDTHVHLRIAEPLFGPVVMDELLVLVDDVVREFASALEFELFQQVLLLALRNALELPVVDAGTLLEEDLQVEAVALDLGADLHVREKPLAPEP